MENTIETAQVEETVVGSEQEGALQSEFTVEEAQLLRIQNAFYKQQNAQLRLEQAQLGIAQLEQEFQRLGNTASETLALFVQQEMGLTLQEFANQYEFNIDTGVIKRLQK